MNSTFPNKIDEVPTFLDVGEQDGVLIKQFEDYMYNGDYQNASLVLNQIPNANQKIITADRMNTLRNCIIRIEEFYKNEIDSKIKENQSKWQATIDKFQYLGEYSSNTNYRINNMVSFNIDGTNYLFIRTGKDNLANIPPADTSAWRKFTIEGKRGYTSQDVTTFCFQWKSNENYSAKSIVSYNNKWWVALKPNINSEPSSINTNWRVIMESMQTVYPVSVNQPPSQKTGELWFRIREDV